MSHTQFVDVRARWLPEQSVAIVRSALHLICR